MDDGRERAFQFGRNSYQGMNMNLLDDLNRQMTRRHFFGRSATGIGSIALASLLRRDLFAATPNSRPAPPGIIHPLHFPARAKRIIYLFQSGAPSQLDLFDYKPQLISLNGKPMPESFTKGQRIAQLAGQKLVEGDTIVTLFPTERGTLQMGPQVKVDVLPEGTETLAPEDDRPGQQLTDLPRF